MIHLILDNIRSLHNVGSLFRTADGAGIARLHLCEHTATPPRNEIAKTALGAEHFVPWTHWSDTERCLRTLKSQGFTLIALEISDQSIDYRQLETLPTENIAILVGHEVHGVSDHIQNLCDITLHLPMRGQKGSLNVCQAAAVLMYHICDKAEAQKSARL